MKWCRVVGGVENGSWWSSRMPLTVRIPVHPPRYLSATGTDPPELHPTCEKYHQCRVRIAGRVIAIYAEEHLSAKEAIEAMDLLREQRR